MVLRRRCEDCHTDKNPILLKPKKKRGPKSKT